MVRLSPTGRRGAAVACAVVLAATGCGADPQVWEGPDGRVTAQPGSSHCDEESVLFLTLGGEQYVFDPGAVIERQLLVGETDNDAHLPADAVDTGLRRSSAELWLAADGDAIYVVSGDNVHKWPRAIEPLGCD